MEINENALQALKEKLEGAMEAQRRSLLGFAGENRASVEEIYAALLAQAEETAGYYPEFDLKLELENGEFLALLRTGLPLRRAYEAVHHQQLVEAAARFGAAHAGARRPGENGLDSQAAASTSGGMAASTRAQRDAIRSRVSRGETVRL